MTTLLDTNILTRMAQTGDPMHINAADATDELRRQGEVLCVVPQNCFEFWVVATRPKAQNGLGFTPPQAQTELARLKGLFTVLDETSDFLPRWEQLVAQYQVSGKNAHDTRLVAAMMVHGISRILTFNVGDFKRYAGIAVLDPQQVVPSRPPTP